MPSSHRRGDIRVAELSKLHLYNFVIGLRQRGLKPGGVNVRLRTLNSFSSRLYEQQLTENLLKAKLLPAPQKAITAISDADVRKLAVFRPRGGFQQPAEVV